MSTLLKISQCEYSATLKVSLVLHMAKHTGINPYKCSQCEYSTSHKGNFVRHVATHSGKGGRQEICWIN